MKKRDFLFIKVKNCPKKQEKDQKSFLEIDTAGKKHDFIFIKSVYKNRVMLIASHIQKLSLFQSFEEPRTGLPN